MTVDPGTQQASASSYQRRHLSFLLGRLPDQIRRADPERYLEQAERGAEHAAVPEGTIYTCPMHPQIRQAGPGACPICGMALEPELVSARRAAQPRTGRHDAAVLGRPRACRFRWSCWRWAATWSAVTAGSTRRCRTGFSSSFATPVVLWAGWPFFVRGWQSLLTRNLNMFTLIAMGTGVALLYSVVATFAPGDLPGRLSRT